MPRDAYLITDDPAEESAVLAVLGSSLDMNDSGSFEARCRQLLLSERPQLAIDLSAVEHVPSTVLSVIVSTDVAARRSGRSLTVRCGPLVARTLQLLLPASVEATG